MEQLEIKARNIRIATIIAMPALVITGEKFRYAHLSWVKCKDGSNYEIIFDQHGQPLHDEDLMRRMATFYNKTFVEIRFEGQKAYAQIN